MPSKPPKLTITVDGPIDSGKTHLLLKLQEFLKATYGTDVRVKVDALTMTRYDGHEHGPARPHRGTEIELISTTTDRIQLVMDPHRPTLVPELVVESTEYGLRVYIDQQKVYAVRGVALTLVPNVNQLYGPAREWAIRALAGQSSPVNPYKDRHGFIHNEAERVSMETLTKTVYVWATERPIKLEDLKGSTYAWARRFGAEYTQPRKYVTTTTHNLSMRLPQCTLVHTRNGNPVTDWNTLTDSAFDWALQVMCDNGQRVLADMHEYKRRPYLKGPKPVPTKEQEVTKLLPRRVSWLSRLKGFILGRAPETRTLDELKVTKTGVAVSCGEEPATVSTQAEVDGRLYVAHATTTEQLNTHAESLGIDLPGPAETGEAVVTHLVFLDAQGNPAKPEPMYDALNALDRQIHASFGMTPAEMGIVPIEVEVVQEPLKAIQPAVVYESLDLSTPAMDKLPELSHNLDDIFLADKNRLTAALGNLPDDALPHEVTAATQEVIDRLGGIVPHHHGHARKVMPLDGPTGKKSTYNSRAAKPSRKKKPRK